MQIKKIKGDNVEIPYKEEDRIWGRNGVEIYSNKEVEKYRETGILFKDGSLVDWESRSLINTDKKTYIQVIYRKDGETELQIAGAAPTYNITTKSAKINLQGCQVGVIGNGARIGKIEF